jgi:DNA helicase-2/ATP-dependent DNA helicase PcrA
MEEERRLCYVGMTRAREELYLSYAQSRFLYGSRAYNMPSRFLADSGAQMARVEHEWNDARHSESISGSFSNNGIDSPNESANDRANLSREPQIVYDEIDLKPGDQVQHQIFGRGEIISINGEIVEVQFATGSPKKLNVAFAPLQKL